MRFIFSSSFLFVLAHIIINTLQLHQFYSQPVCPVSSILKPHQGYVNYPLEIFNKSLLISDYISKRTVQCTIIIKHSQQKRTCPIESSPDICPVQQQNINDASLITWNYSTSLCHAYQTVKKKDPIRVFITGGSLTEGRSTGGCCCNPKIDEKCPINQCYATKEPIDGSFTCRWSNYLSMYLNARLQTNVSVINLASSALSTDKCLEENNKYLMNMTSSDIVMLDHSVNDGFYFHRPGYDKTLLNAIEHLIRFIFDHCISPPTIILLEMWPFPYGGYLFRKRYDKLVGTKADYGTTYRQVAQYYSIPIWSYRNVLWSEFAEKYQDDILDELKFMQGNFGYLHPGWYIHMFYADLLAGIFNQEFEKCEQQNILPVLRNVHQLPKALTASVLNLCVNDPSATLLSISFEKEPKSTTMDIFQEYNITSTVGKWIHSYDKPGRYGLLSDLSVSKSPEKSIMIPFRNLDLKMNTAPFLITIKFLRSYVNGGMFDVYLCGHYLLGFDTIWKDFKTYKVSSVESASLINDPFGNPRKFFCKNEKYPTIEIRHYRVGRDLKFAVRGPTQKIKINSIQICQIDTNYAGGLKE